MKQNRPYAAFAAAVTILFCSACGGQTDKPDMENQKIIIGENQNDTAEPMPAAPSDTPGKSDDNAGKSPETPDNTTNLTCRVTIDWQTEETQDTAEDGTILFIGSLYYPVVAIEGNEEAAAKINADIQNRLAAFQQDTSVRDFARENYVPENSGFISYNCDFTFSSRRADSNVISFKATYYSYSGGAHGNYTGIGINYNTQTGEIIEFQELGENADAFQADTFAYNRALADTKPYLNKMYGRPSDEELESVLYAEDKWFLSTDGLTFISDPYALGPYAGGAIDFTIPYGELEQMGLKEEYRYAGHLTMRLQESLPALMDLNGDGMEETILYDTVYDDSPDAESEFTANLLINDIDITRNSDELRKLLLDFPWAQCVLYDLDSSDDMVEIAFLTTEYIGEDDTPYYTSCFFRYEKNSDSKTEAAITFLGKTEGSLLEPGFEVSLTAPQQVSIDWQTLRNEESAEDGTIIFRCDCLYPVVSIEGSESAAAKINADIQARVDAFQADTSSLAYAREYYSEYGGFGGFDSLVYEAGRSDNHVISFLITSYGFMGGAAHGNYGNYGVNYDARTGEPIAFSMLASDADHFFEDTFTYNRELAASEAYQKRLFVNTTDERLRDVLYREGSWFLSTSGLTFFSSPYALASYADGTITFVIPYDELKKMDLKPEYQYSGNLTLNLEPHLVYSLDLNGDTQKDSFQFYNAYEKDANGKGGYWAHLIINDTDVIQKEMRNGNDALSRLLADSCWTTCALYDLNPFDRTIEVAIMTAEDYEEGEVRSVTSHLFRYEKSGGIIYLGKIDGDITDPTVEHSLSAP